MDIEASFLNYMRSAITSMKLYEERLLCLQKQIRRIKTKSLPKEHINLILNNIYKFIEISDEGIALLESAIAEFPLSINWLPKSGDVIEMSWETGVLPWSIWLKYKGQKDEISYIKQSIKQKWLNGELEKELYPEEGMNVVICCKKRVYRGLIIAVSSIGLQVLNVDDGKEWEEDLDSCYKLLKEFAEPHAHVIRCSIGNEEIEAAWKLQYCQDFIPLLQYSKLNVKILNEIDSVPPTFIVDINAFNEDSESEVNIAQWISEKCQNFMPLANEMNSLNLSQSELNSNLCPTNEHRLNKANRKLSSSSIFDNHETKLPFSIPSQPNQHISSNLLNGFMEVEKNTEKNRLLKAAHAINMSCQTKDISKTSPFKFESVIDVPEFLPTKKKEDNTSLSGNTLPAMNGSNESSVLPGQYKPTDDSRICSYFARHNYCWKTGCRKEHVKVMQDKWTDDKEEVFCDTIARIKLPEIGSDLCVTVSHVTSSNAFYSLLPESYSATEDGETFLHLIKSLNNSTTHKELQILTTPPCFGQFLIAYNATKKQWERASVYDVFDEETVQVFFVDSGVTEDVPVDKCRAMLPQFNHLPSQAVYITLAGVYLPDLGANNSEGAEYLSSCILNKSLNIHVVDRNLDENRLEVEAFINDENISSLMVSKGFCARSNFHL